MTLQCMSVHEYIWIAGAMPLCASFETGRHGGMCHGHGHAWGLYNRESARRVLLQGGMVYGKENSPCFLPRSTRPEVIGDSRTGTVVQKHACAETRINMHVGECDCLVCPSVSGACTQAELTDCVL